MNDKILGVLLGGLRWLSVLLIVGIVVGTCVYSAPQDSVPCNKPLGRTFPVVCR